MSNDRFGSAHLSLILGHPSAEWFPVNHVEQLRDAQTDALIELTATRERDGSLQFELICSRPGGDTYRSRIQRPEFLAAIQSPRPYAPRLLRALGETALADIAARANSEPKLQLEGVGVGPVSLQVFVEVPDPAQTPPDPRYTIVAHIDRNGRFEIWEAVISEMAIAEAYASSQPLLDSAVKSDVTFVLTSPPSMPSSVLFASAWADVERVDMEAASSASAPTSRPKGL